MNRILGLACFLTASTLFSACVGNPTTRPGDDELAGETGDGEQPKADGGLDTFGIYTAVEVGAFDGKGAGRGTHVTLARANRSTTKCADGTTAASCDVRALDLSKLGLSSDQLETATRQLEASAADPSLGAQLLVRGRYVEDASLRDPDAGGVTFEVSELWTAQIPGGTLDGTFVMVHDNGRRCITAPCADLTEARVNSVRAMAIHGLDWSWGVPQDEALRDRVTEAAFEPEGLIVTGFRTHGTVAGQQTTLRTPEQVFLRVQP
jgi:hypothetical protein